MNSRLRGWVAAATAVSALAASGLVAGCHDGHEAPADGAQVTISGVVAQGDAVAGATVSAKCASGSGSAVSTASGSYRLEIATGRLPCLLRARSADGTTQLHSIAAGAGLGSATAHVTPLSELLLARLAGLPAAGYFDSVDGATLSEAVSAAHIGSAQAAVLAALADAGINAGTIVNLLTDTLVAATPGSSGNSFDNVLDALHTALANGGTTLDAVATALVAASGTAGGSSAATLPPDMLLKPAAPECPALRSGRYRFVSLEATGGTTSFPTDIVTIDAVAHTLSRGGGVSGFSANSACRYTFASNDGSDFVVAPSGLLVVHGKPTSDTFRMTIGLPEQTHGLDELAGEWNLLGLANDTGPVRNSAGTLTIAATGAVTAGTWCSDLFNCQALAAADLPENKFAANTGGGFDWLNTTGDADAAERVFAYRAGSGDLLLVGVGHAGRPMLWSKKRSLVLPAVGTTTDYWSLTVSATLSVDTFTDGGNTILTADSGSSSFTRSNLINAATGRTRVETLVHNTPRDGYTYRSATTVTASDGTPSNVPELVTLSLRGMGIAPVAFTANNTFSLSVNKP